MQMFGCEAITDDVVRAAVEGSATDRERVLMALTPQVRSMAMIRLSPTPNQYGFIEDLTQEALLAISDGLPRLRSPTISSLKSFASVIVTRAVVRFLNEDGAGKRRDLASLDSTVAGTTSCGPLGQFLSASGVSPRSAVANAEQFLRTVDELGQLKPEFREVITLAFFDQLPTKEIAERLNLSRPAASMLLFRAVRALRRNMTGSSGVRDGDGL